MCDLKIISHKLFKIYDKRTENNSYIHTLHTIHTKRYLKQYMVIINSFLCHCQIFQNRFRAHVDPVKLHIRLAYSVSLLVPVHPRTYVRQWPIRFVNNMVSYVNLLYIREDFFVFVTPLFRAFFVWRIWC